MINFKQYCENKETKEEMSGIDIDHDKEKGESKTHINKINKKHKENLEFFRKRKEGAAKIAAEAKIKGGPSELTFWHFTAKAKPYSEVIQAIENNKDENYFKSKCNSLLSKLKIGKIGQKEFQSLMGELEVFGEALEQIFDK